ncbi:hypothetical protein [Duganella callida]|uniref:Uncharacterized protein n=1 Tax=Duganella callida TaxID=2561932 RepID=A0A4Y9S3S2_9BURK|nr:hypothetical protein [Duganella callida]TFW15970.1 hypothetical protein E4L98_25080 [Duganella callida]
MNTAQTIIATGFDISALTAAPADPATFNVDLIFNADGDAVSGLICVGKNSHQYQEITKTIRAENLKRGARTGTAIDTKTDEGAALAVDLSNENAKRIALAVTVGWFGFTSAGAPAPFDKNLIKAGFDSRPTWVDAVTAGLEKDANFSKLLPKASSTSPATSSNG